MTFAAANAQETRVGDTGRNYRVWQTIEVDASGSAALSTNCFVELATGLNYWNKETGQYEPSQELFEITPEGYAVAQKGPYRLIIAPNINEPGSVDLLTPDGKRFRSNPMGLSFRDLSSGKNILIAEVKDCEGQLVSENVILFPDAFDHVHAALKYTYCRHRFEQDVVIYENPPLPPDLDPETTVLEMYTEFFDPPTPETSSVEKIDGWVDENLEFGAMRIADGAAYVLNEVALESVDTFKTWVGFPGDDGGSRQFLIESVPYLRILPLLERVPLANDIPLPKAVAQGRLELVQRMPIRSAKHLDGLLAAIKPGAEIGSPAVVLDYPQTLTDGLTNFVLAGNVTYYVGGGGINLYGTTVLEPCVVKYTNSGNATLTIHGPLDCQTSLYRRASFCAKDDNTVGETISGSSGTPSGYYANPALEFRTANAQLRHVRIANAQLGVFYYDYSAGGDNAVSHAQFVDCDVALQFNGYGATFQNFGARNLLLDNCNTAFKGYSFNGTVEHLTVAGCSFLAHDYKGQDYGTTSSLSVKNSLLVDLGSYYDTRYVAINLNASQVLASPDNVFQQAGGGYRYLVPGSPYRNAGTDSISAELRDELKQMTTYPPLELTTDITASTTLWPQAQRAAAGNSLGYHYPALDYLWSGLNLTNATLTLTNGVVIGIEGNIGMTLRNGARFISEGTPLQPNRLVLMNAVQERGSSPASGGSLLTLGSTVSEVRLRYTDVSVGTGPKSLVGGLGANVISTFAIADSEIHGASLGVYAYASGMTIQLNNSLLDRCAVSFYQPSYVGYYPFTLNAYNCLFRCGSLALTYDNPYTTWTIQDNLFDADSLSVSGSYTPSASYNGYRSGLSSLGSTGNRTNLVPDYQVGPLGRFYYPASGSASSLTNLYDAGSRTANNAGLYHHTTRLDQDKEGTSIVDIGYHYVAVPKVTFVGVDTATQGDWKDVYGVDGYEVIQDASAYPGYAAVTPSGKNNYTWDAAPADIRALQRAASGRIAACWYSTGSSFDLILSQSDARPHRLALYFLDWDSNARAQTIDIRETAGSTVYDTRSASEFNPGKYFVWDILGNATLRVTRMGINNAVVSGLFFGPAPTALWDTDDDGLPDYFEDRDGDNTVDPGETNWQISENGTTGVPGLQVFTVLD